MASTWDRKRIKYYEIKALTHLLKDGLRDFVIDCDFDVLRLTCAKDAFCVFELHHSLSRLMHSSRYSNNDQIFLKHCVSESTMGLSVAHEHLLHDFTRVHCVEDSCLGPSLVDVCVAGDPVSW